ncbi:cytochrome P450 [Nonomuraea soli]|uniref:Cytochrome P450 n=1 Tax=Nonomuraea soli TaxID=1032476 RepID=A0A7W0HP89_9ACTN|nr:cytochrome P450 [Nonomuraea soli]MBA2890620.1 cytochrome P450 [Nonomuraea soli]
MTDVMAPTSLPCATVAENAALTATFFAPSLLRGTITSVGAGHTLTTRLDTLRRAQRLMAGLRSRYGGAVLVRGPGGPTLLVLGREQVRRVLTAPDDLFSLASPEKVNGLGPFLEGTLLLSSGPPREDRRGFVTRVLEEPTLRARFAAVAREEAATLVPGVLTYPALNECWNRVARRCLYGDGARDLTELSTLLADLRRAGNWLGLRQGRQRELSARYDALILRELARSEPGSLAGAVASQPHPASACPVRQAAFWLMGFTVPPPGLMQALALLAARGPADPRAALLEGLRLWAPVPALMRTVTSDTSWEGARLPKGTSVLIPLILHQRDPALPYADRFAPEIWLDGTAEREWLIAPFSRGPGQCKGMNLALHVGAAFLGEVVRLARVRGPYLPEPLPLMLDTLRLRLVLEAR